MGNFASVISPFQKQSTADKNICRLDRGDVGLVQIDEDRARVMAARARRRGDFIREIWDNPRKSNQH